MSDAWDEDLVTADRSDLEWAIAELLSILSQATDVPTEIDPSASAFSASGVDFSTSSWIVSLVSVSGWLRFGEPLRLNSTSQFVTTLVRGLGFDSLTESTESSADGTRLSEVGLDRLRERCERAAQLQCEFVEALEADGGTIASATGIWKEAWEVAPEEEEEESSGPVTAKAQIWPIQEFGDKAEEGKLNLSPSYQRGDVWPLTDSQMLIESILRGIPLPSVIILKPQDQFEAPFEVVDGKQRLTAILRFIGRHPHALSLVKAAESRHPGSNLLHLFQSDYKAFRTAWVEFEGEPLTASAEARNYFPYKLRANAKPLQGELADLQGKYYTQIRMRPIEVADDRVEIRQIFERVSEYKIPVIEYSRATRRQIHEVFNLYNKQGKHLNAEEIRNAVFHHVDFMRGLMVASGDSEHPGEVAPFLVPIWPDLRKIQVFLTEYGFGTSRYRRTKVLSWLASILFFDSVGPNGPRLQSTAKQIDSLLERIDSHGDLSSDPLRSHATIRNAFALMSFGFEAHAEIDEAWAPQFMDTKVGAKWQELQLIGSLLGVTIAASVLGLDTKEALGSVAGSLRAKSSQTDWRRPTKTQTATQWQYIARIAILIVEELGIDPQDADQAIRKQFGESGVRALIDLYRSGQVEQHPV